MTDVGDAGPGDALAILADQFGQLAVQLADGVDQPLAQQRLVEFAVRGVPGAEHASMTMVEQDAARQDTANHLLRAWETNREIGVAMGILMANGRLTNQQAFAGLRTASQHLNRKLRDIAADVASTGQLPPVRRRQGRA